MLLPLEDKLFKIKTESEFNELALQIFRIQSNEVPVYREYLKCLRVDLSKIDSIEKIPFLPIEFFKSHVVAANGKASEKFFESSGTSGTNVSKHFIHNLKLYEQSFVNCFRAFYGEPDKYCIVALLPSYLEKLHSSLVYMMSKLIEKSCNKSSGFFLYNYDNLARTIEFNESENQKTLLLGVSFALMDFATKHSFQLNNTIVMETGGMKGKRDELTRNEFHEFLQKQFGLQSIHSEYGMTELLSQSYSKSDGKFYSPSWKKVYIRSINDPFQVSSEPGSGAINIIDLANLYSCSFLETKDLGKINVDGSFEITGRMDYSDERGCNLLVL